MGLHTMPECSELLVCIIAAALERRSARRADAQVPPPPPQAALSSKFAAFNDPCAAVVSLLDLVTQVADGSTATPCILLAALVLLDRVSASCALSERNVCRLFSVAVTIATKYVEDLYDTNARAARVIGVTLQCYNAMEVLFLRSIGFDAGVSARHLAAMDASAVADACESCYGPIIVPALREARLIAPSAPPPARRDEGPAAPALPAPGGGGPPGFAPVPVPPSWKTKAPHGCGSPMSPHSPHAVCDASLASPGSVCTASPVRLARVPPPIDTLVYGAADGPMWDLPPNDPPPSRWRDPGLDAPSYQYFDRLLELADMHDQSVFESVVDDSDDALPAWAADMAGACSGAHSYEAPYDLPYVPV